MSRLKIVNALLCCLLGQPFFCVATARSEILPSNQPVYVNPPAFTPLPLGEVKPARWLLDCCRSAANGITGHTDELDPLFEKGWLDADARFFW